MWDQIQNRSPNKREIICTRANGGCLHLEKWIQHLRKIKAVFLLTRAISFSKTCASWQCSWRTGPRAGASSMILLNLSFSISVYLSWVSWPIKWNIVDHLRFAIVLILGFIGFEKTSWPKDALHVFTLTDPHIYSHRKHSCSIIIWS